MLVVYSIALLPGPERPSRPESGSIVERPGEGVKRASRTGRLTGGAERGRLIRTLGGRKDESTGWKAK